MSEVPLYPEPKPQLQTVRARQASGVADQFEYFRGSNQALLCTVKKNVLNEIAFLVEIFFALFFFFNTL